MNFKFKKSGSIKVVSISFLCAQEGQPETELKLRLSNYFKSEVAVSSAFLLRVRYGSSAEQNVALCLTADSLNKQALQQHISGIFREMFNTEQSLDIIFLSPDQVQQALKAGKPFYVQKAERM